MWWILIGCVILIGILLLIRSGYECRTLTVTNYHIQTDRVGKAFCGFRMAVLADLHENSFGKKNQKLIETIKKENPDIILIAGDLIITKEWKEKDFTVLRELLWQLKKYPVFYGTGNHEQRMEVERERYPGWDKEFKTILKRCGIHYLNNDSVVLQRGDERIRITGVALDMEYYQKGSPKEMKMTYLEEKLGKCKKDGYQILLAHSPLYLEQYEQWGADLTFSGHFHGGTIRLPYLGGIMSPQLQFFTKRDKGQLKIGHADCIISGGLGTHSINIRLNNLPELIIVTLNSYDHKKGENY